MRLCDLQVDNSTYIKKINLDDISKIRLYDLGLIEGTKVKLIIRGKGINAYSFRNTLLAIRNEDAKGILVGEIYD